MEFDQIFNFINNNIFNFVNDNMLQIGWFSDTWDSVKKAGSFLVDGVVLAASLYLTLPILIILILFLTLVFTTLFSMWTTYKTFVKPIIKFISGGWKDKAKGAVGNAAKKGAGKLKNKVMKR